MGENAALEKSFLGLLPELPCAAKNFINLIGEINIERNAYSNFLSSDSVLSSRIFSYINRVYPKSEGEFISINKGVSIMGLHKFKNLVISLALFPVFEEAGCTDLFKHSLLSAYYSKEIALKFDLINPDDAFLLGFLHDIGKIPMKNKFGTSYEILPLQDEEFHADCSIKNEISEFGVSHSELSGYISSLWNLPYVICNAIEHHHNPMNAILVQAASVVFMADVILRKNTRLNEFEQKVFDYMLLTKSELLQKIAPCDKKIIPYLEVLDI